MAGFSVTNGAIQLDFNTTNHLNGWSSPASNGSRPVVQEYLQYVERKALLDFNVCDGTNVYTFVPQLEHTMVLTPKARAGRGVSSMMMMSLVLRWSPPQSLQVVLWSGRWCRVSTLLVIQHVCKPYLHMVLPLSLSSPPPSSLSSPLFLLLPSSLLPLLPSCSLLLLPLPLSISISTVQLDSSNL